MKLPTPHQIIALATSLSVSLGLCLGFAVGQSRMSDLPSAGPPSLEGNYRPWRIVPQRKVKGFVSDFRPNNAEKQLLVLSREDQKKFADQINQPNAGGFRLVTRHPVGSGVISIKSPEFSRRPGFSVYANSYSFTRKKHGHGVSGWDRNVNWNLTDLRLMRGRLFSAVAEESVGLMVQLGDVPLEHVNEQTNGVVELAELVPPTDYRAAASLFEKNHCAYERNGFRYASHAVAAVNSTYVLRSTLNRRADQLIAFRVIGKDDEQTLSIIWKKLKTYPKPSWTSGKQENPDMKIYKPCPHDRRPKT